MLTSHRFQPIWSPSKHLPPIATARRTLLAGTGQSRIYVTAYFFTFEGQADAVGHGYNFDITCTRSVQDSRFCERKRKQCWFCGRGWRGGGTFQRRAEVGVGDPLQVKCRIFLSTFEHILVLFFSRWYAILLSSDRPTVFVQLFPVVLSTHANGRRNSYDGCLFFVRGCGAGAFRLEPLARLYLHALWRSNRHRVSRITFLHA